uniref:RCC1-like domain-containing protein n=1 Tax=Chromera velia CCMP2878 TaxID=1169474 RepID=A0A0K6SAB2_9ALVE|eukprot:Cvel_1509.t2-p1 / transcript=Cvel_1509.t2 / gene=Cvel_1509 / organism=Chromera_velia_CCMP2878 / gene_product=Probable E3 ubiquitin-protein ligase HERC4, putative / transcript_product=Probable E3 ubiquitin-protein ligase HERC4, putative / location=Cvel_scaffold53:50185-53317(+) / protein_length=757 / sequence_SO=supercontig / SO=protein_coding / is_pseudo=false
MSAGAHGDMSVLGLHHSLLLSKSGGVYASGRNDFGQLGVGDTVHRRDFTRISGICNAVSACVGLRHSLVLEENGEVKAFGSNDAGQLGVGESVDQLETPRTVTVEGASSLVGVACGRRFSMVWDTEGRLFGSGTNVLGQMGDGTSGDGTEKFRFAQVTEGGLSSERVIWATAGSTHVLALCASGSVFAWGSNLNGQLGLGDNGPDVPLSATPVEMSSPYGPIIVAELSAGESTSFVRAANGELYGWGSDEFGQMCQGTTAYDRKSPVLIATGVMQAVGGRDHVLFQKSDGTLFGCGRNHVGQLGLSASTTFISSQTVIPIPGGSSVTSLMKSGPLGDASIVLTPSPVVFGQNEYGKLGTGMNATEFTPRALKGIGSDTCTSVPSSCAPNAETNSSALGVRHSLLLSKTGSVYASGRNDFGQLGSGDEVSSNVFKRVLGVCNAVSACAGFRHSLVLEENGEVKAFGSNDAGQLGVGESVDQLETPRTVTVEGASSLVGVACGHRFSLVWDSEGRVFSTGENSVGQLGNGTWGSGTEKSSFMRVTAGGLSAERVVAAATGSDHALVLCDSGKLFSWGGNDHGQLGHGDTTDRSVPTEMTSASSAARISEISVGSLSSLVRTEDGEVYGWGWDTHGQMCQRSTSISRTSPVLIATGVTEMVGGRSHTLLKVTNGTVFGCGRNHVGQLGLGASTTFVSSPTVIPIPGESSVTSLMKSGPLGDASIVLTPSPVVFGQNEDGQLGTGANSAEYTPKALAGAVN